LGLWIFIAAGEEKKRASESNKKKKRRFIHRFYLSAFYDKPFYTFLVNPSVLLCILRDDYNPAILAFPLRPYSEIWKLRQSAQIVFKRRLLKARNTKDPKRQKIETYERTGTCIQDIKLFLFGEEKSS